MKVWLNNKYKSVRKVSVFLLFIVVLLLALFIFISVLVRFKPVFQEKAVMLAKVRATEIINTAVIDVFSGIDFDEFVNISKKETGEVMSISADSIKMNKLKAMISQSVSDKAKNDEDYYVHIPLGSLTKYPVLQGMGYRIPIKVSLDGVTKTDFEEEFVASGINQVKNRIFIVISARISIISSLMTVSEVVSTEVPVSETIIVGDVPNYYGDRLGVVGR